MVFYTCSGCGESLKKNKVEKHVYTCRGCEYLTCIDCSQDFYGDDYKNHNMCMTEDQKYSAKGTQFKPNKGDVKQQKWLDNLESVLSDPGMKLSTKAKDLIHSLKNYDNIPRKRPKFLNFVKNSLRIYDSKLGEEVWDAFSAANKKPDENSTKSDKNDNSNIADEKNVQNDVKNVPKDADTTKNCDSEKIKKKKKKKRKSESVDDSLEQNFIEDVAVKMKKSKENIETAKREVKDHLDESSTENGVAKKKKKKKLKNRDKNENLSPNQGKKDSDQNNENQGKNTEILPKKKKRKLEEAETNENAELQNFKKEKSKKKKKRNELTENGEKNESATGIENGTENAELSPMKRKKNPENANNLTEVHKKKKKKTETAENGLENNECGTKVKHSESDVDKKILKTKKKKKKFKIGVNDSGLV